MNYQCDAHQYLSSIPPGPIVRIRIEGLKAPLFGYFLPNTPPPAP